MRPLFMAFLIFFAYVYFTYLYADDVLNNTQKNIFKYTEQKGKLDADVTKDSWINSINLGSSYDRTKSIGSPYIKSKKVYVDVEQEIYNGGGILSTIKKGKLLDNINLLSVSSDKKELLSQLYEYVINIQKIDLEIKKLYYLIDSQNIEIARKEASYTNGLIDISELDESVIGLSELKNQKEDLRIQRLEYLSELKKYSDMNYKDIDISFLNMIDFESFMKNNYKSNIQELQTKQSILDDKITQSSFAPNLATFVSYGYDDNTYSGDGEYYSYGIKVSVPFSISESQTEQSSKLAVLLEKQKQEQIQKDQRTFFNSSIQKLEYLDNKINNIDETIIRYDNLYKMLKQLYESSIKTIEDVDIMKNRVESNKIDKKIVKLDKKLILNQIYTKVIKND